MLIPPDFVKDDQAILEQIRRGQRVESYEMKCGHDDNVFVKFAK